MAPSRVWLITGASSGFGLELAKVTASRGDRVIATTRFPEKLAGLDGVTPAYLDHNRSPAEIENAIKAIIDIYGTVDVVVNNAAYVQTGTLEEVTPEEILKEFQANTFGPINVYRAILPHLRKKGAGTLVTIGSMAAWYSMPACNLYNASKAALRQLVIGLAGEVEHFGIRHCLIEPGYFRTGLLKPDANLAGTDHTRRIPDYEKLNAVADENFRNFHGNQLGNTIKGVEIIYDVVTSSGVADGLDLPGFFPLGSDAITEIAKSAQSTLDDVKKWAPIARESDFKEWE
ncbi:short chain dehydrogenase [Seiridium cupressi]